MKQYNNEIRHGAFVIMLNEDGKPIGYRITLALPKEWAEENKLTYVICLRKRYYYIREFKDFDDMHRVLLALQLEITQYKLRLLDVRHMRLLDKLSQVDRNKQGIEINLN